MAFLDRIFRDNENPDVTRLSVHDLAAGMQLVVLGDITVSQFKNAMGLTVDDDQQLDELRTHYQGLSVDDKKEFFARFTAWTVLAASGRLTRTQLANKFGMTE